jgi:hypothetical protein
VVFFIHFFQSVTHTGNGFSSHSDNISSRAFGGYSYRCATSRGQSNDWANQDQARQTACDSRTPQLTSCMTLLICVVVLI